MYFTSPTNGVAVTYDGAILLTTDGGLNWTTDGSPRFCCGEKYDLQFVNNTTGFLTNGEHAIYRSADGGRSWQRVYYNGAVLLSNLHFVTPLVGYAVGEESNSASLTPGVVLQTVDGGTTWSLIRKTAAALHDVYFSDAATGYVVGGNGNILVTRDGGTNWQNDVSPTANGLDRIFPTENGTLYLWGYLTSTLLKKPVKPVADFAMSQATVCASDTVVFTNRSKDSYNYTWKIGEEVFSTEPAPRRSFAKPGSYVITLIADNCGDSDTLQRALTILPLPPKPRLSIGGSPVTARQYLACDVDSLTISTVALPEYQSYFWKGRAVPGGTSLTIYRSDTLFVKVQGKNGCFAVSDTLKVTFQKSPAPAFVPTASCLSVRFENTSRFGERCQWDFGDGTTDTTRSPVHQFADSGRYNVQLTVTNACGTARVSQWITLAWPAKPQLLIGGKAVDAGEYVACDQDTLVIATTTAPDYAAYYWNGSTVAGAGSLRMTASGNAYVRIRNANGCFTGSDTLHVTFRQRPAARFNYEANGLEVTFTNTSERGGQFRWYFGDGSVDTTRSPVHTYLEAGNYRVALTAANGCGGDSVSKMVPVVITSLAAAPKLAGLRVFPNPARGSLHVELPAELGRPTTVSLVNSVGIARVLVVTPAESRLQLDVSELEAGVYLLKVDWPDRYGSQKVVIR
jgi:PKD repeat protein